jgi:hypothetical protein
MGMRLEIRRHSSLTKKGPHAIDPSRLPRSKFRLSSRDWPLLEGVTQRESKLKNLEETRVDE